MKGIILTPMFILLAGCSCCNTGVVEYRQVTFTPTVVATPVIETPVYYDPVTIIDDDPIDVTTTTIDYY